MGLGGGLFLFLMSRQIQGRRWSVDSCQPGIIRGASMEGSSLPLGASCSGQATWAGRPVRDLLESISGVTAERSLVRSDSVVLRNQGEGCSLHAEVWCAPRDFGLSMSGVGVACTVLV